MSASDTKTISVIVPAYNSEDFLDTALASVLGQTHPAHQVIVVNDCSTDQTLAVAKKWQDRLPLTLIDKTTNEGLGAARRTAGEAATGDLIALLDSDDVWFPDHLQLALSQVQDSNSLVTASTLRWYPGEKLGANGSTDLFPIPHKDEQLHKLLEFNYLFSGSVFDRQTYLDAGGFSTRRKNEDWELWIRMLLGGCEVIGMPQPTVLYRQHSASLSSADGCLDDDIDMFNELLKTLTGTNRDVVVKALRRRKARRTMIDGLQAYDNGDGKTARKMFLKAAVTDRSLRGGRSSQMGSVALRSGIAMLAPQWAAKQRNDRSTNPDAIRTGR